MSVVSSRFTKYKENLGPDGEGVDVPSFFPLMPGSEKVEKYSLMILRTLS